MATRRMTTGSVAVDGAEVFFRRLGGDGPPTVLVHGNPTDSGDWLPFMDRLAGPAIALDLPGWGRSTRPAGFDGSFEGMAAFFERFLERLGIDEHSLVVHDWGALALIAERRPPRLLRRLVVINAVPLLAGYRWHWVARLWRRRRLPELLSWAVTRPVVAAGLRLATGDRGPMAPEIVDRAHAQLSDRGRLDAVLELYRSANPERLAAAGANLDRLACRALVVWGGRDPYLGAELGRRYAERLPQAELVELPDAGHWPWIDEPSVIDRVAAFLQAGSAAGLSPGGE